MARVPMTGDQYEAVKARDIRRCARCGTPTLEGHWHHRRSKSIRDECVHESCNGVWLDAACHAWVHAHPFEARELGFIVSRYKIPHEEPMKSAVFGWIQPTHGGEFTPANEPV